MTQSLLACFCLPSGQPGGLPSYAAQTNQTTSVEFTRPLLKMQMRSDKRCILLGLVRVVIVIFGMHDFWSCPVF